MSLGRFAGFKINSGARSFNPFSEEAQEVQEPRVEKPLKLTNILDAPPPVSQDVRTFFPVASTEATQAPAPARALEEGQMPPHIIKPLFPKADVEAVVPMIQPRSKEGQRLLYKHPNLPKVGVAGAYMLLVGESDRSQAAWLMQFDGAANPNPGPASAGAVLWSPMDLDGKRSPIFESGKYLGKATNNIAEVQGLLLGLQIAAMRGARELLIEGDSELIIFHQTGKYKVSDKNLKVWWANIQAAMMDETSFDWIAIRQVRREHNERADSITKEVLGRKQSFQR